MVICPLFIHTKINSNLQQFTRLTELFLMITLITGKDLGQK